MAASINDKFTRSTDSSTARPVTAQLAAPGKALAASSVNLNVATNWATSTAVHVAMFKVNAQGYKDPTTQTDWKGTLSGTTISNLTLRGGTDQTYVAGDYIEITPTDGFLKDLIDGILTQHNQDGTHGAVTATSLTTSGAITSTGLATLNGGTVLPANDIQANELAINAITLNYSAITTTFTTSSTSAVQVTGLSAAVTIPAGGRKVKITAYAGASLSNNSAALNSLSIWDGTVGSGTQLQTGQTTTSGTGTVGSSAITLQAIVTPSAGAKTYNVGLHTSAGTAAINAGSAFPAFILVEVI